ncbi:DUF1345 domain-containing protein [Fictibacillus sp. KIGAM418]|uniref:DUF1345 domain-containing protein n=1 Tax=Fictibacillus marinisediminis TaxID=2878389 RepID=A0A9X2BC01_9BACL|nr:DUF1345 domain-containing protein [Fictibacillus marinisediminis]MCK6256389.1 DUF1345 domain-containing protein [Fictibacillus marinisediminis]
MKLKMSTKKDYRWPSDVAIVIIGILFKLLSNMVTIGPNWPVFVIAFILYIPLLYAVSSEHDLWSRKFAILRVLVLTFALMSSMVDLVYSLFFGMPSASELFQSAGLLWAANVLIFAIWYWEIDRGGPIRRNSKNPGKPEFGFPQMMSSLPEWEGWKPNFLDYLFVAFNTSVAFSPADTAVFSRRAKLLMMTQSVISLVALVVLAARAINIV